jgi:hypothetical protein
MNGAYDVHHIHRYNIQEARFAPIEALRR